MKWLAGLLVVLALGSALVFLLRNEHEHPEPAARGAHDEGSTASLPRPEFVAELPAPSAEGRPIEPTPTRAVANRLALQIVHATGEPAAGAVVVLADRGRDSPRPDGRAFADAAGLVQFDGCDGPVDVYVGGACRPALKRALDSGRGEQRIELPGGAVVSGRLTIGGQPPGLSIPLATLCQKSSSSDMFPAPIAASLSLAFEDCSFCEAEDAVLVGPDGRFAISGFSEGEHVGLYPADPWIVADESARWVEAPARDLVLDLRRGGVVRLRVVTPDGSEPVPGALVELTTHRRDGAVASGAVAPADADGVIRVPTWRLIDCVHAMDFDIADPAGGGTKHLSVDDLACEADRDLGDVPLDFARAIPFEVVNRAGQPVAGAIAFADTGREIRSEPTDAQGRGVLGEVTLGVSTMSVWAPAAVPVDVPLPRGLPAAPLHVVVSPCASLAVRCPVADGGKRPQLWLVLAADQQFFEDPEGFAPSQRRLQLGAQSNSGSDTRSVKEGDVRRISGLVRYEDIAGRTLDLGCVRPGVPAEFAIIDTTGFVLQSAHLAPLGEGEARVEELVIASLPRELLVEVRDRDGRPIEAAGVDVAPDKQHRHPKGAPGGIGLRTDAQGHISISNLYADFVDVTARKDGFRRTTARAQPGSSVVLTLQPASRLAVHVRDAAGHRVRAQSVGVVDANGKMLVYGQANPTLDPDDEFTRSGASEWNLEHALDGDLTLRARVSGRSVELVTQALATEATIVVPAHGSLRVIWHGETRESRLYALRLEAAGLDVHEYAVPESARAGGTLELPVVFPASYTAAWVELPRPGGEGERRELGRATVVVEADRVAVVDFP